VGGALVWLAGWLMFRAAGNETGTWDALWALAGVSFLSGITATLLLVLSRYPLLGFFGCIGAAVGSAAGASLLLGLGHTGREILRHRATKSRWSRRTLEWSVRLAKRWTYVGITVLLVLQFIPKLVTLYAAVLVNLRTVPFLVAVLVGVFLRNLAVLGFFSLFSW
jgi:uncharacterized membrane protein YdjX (TVP38/TMEM64 family)